MKTIVVLFAILFLISAQESAQIEPENTKESDL